MPHVNQNRRRFFRALVASSAAAPMILSGRAFADTNSGENFVFEVIRTESEWRDRLTELEYRILRRKGTEQPRSNPLWEEARDGIYCCRGCDLTLFDGYWKVILDMGWVFFRQSEPNSILTAIDRAQYEELLSGAEARMGADLTDQELRDLDTLAGVEARCRRCGSHLGHLISHNSSVLYCVNGAALEFYPAET
ncbi:hypothetical protein C2I36_07935 [Rhodobacteraceae bacterium WD3A24]|nr:hypothetical protein C2I36_07935 [Rhodobacteraceae bacterium WD3A24]